MDIFSIFDKYFVDFCGKRFSICREPGTKYWFRHSKYEDFYSELTKLRNKQSTEDTFEVRDAIRRLESFLMKRYLDEYSKDEAKIRKYHWSDANRWEKD